MVVPVYRVVHPKCILPISRTLFVKIYLILAWSSRPNGRVYLALSSIFSTPYLLSCIDFFSPCMKSARTLARQADKGRYTPILRLLLGSHNWSRIAILVSISLDLSLYYICNFFILILMGMAGCIILGPSILQITPGPFSCWVSYEKCTYPPSVARLSFRPRDMCCRLASSDGCQGVVW